MEKNTLQLLQDDDIDIRAIFKAIYNSKKLISIFCILALALSSLYAISLPNIYQATAKIIVNESSNVDFRGSSTSPVNQLAGLAGLNLGTSKNQSVAEAIEKITSLSFFSERLKPSIFLPDLFAAEAWNPKTGKLTYAGEIYNSETESWTRKPNLYGDVQPSDQEAHQEFLKLISVNEDFGNNFIILSVEHPSPLVAKHWNDLMFKEINNHFREYETKVSQKAIQFLNLQLSQSLINETKVVLADLLLEHIKKLTLIESNEEFIFRYIDPAVVPEKIFKPDRFAIIFFSTLFGFGASIFTVLVRSFYF